MKTTVRLIGATLVLAAATVASAAIIYQQDFENGGGSNAWVGEGATVPGQLVGQDGWVNVSNGTLIQVGVGTGSGAGGNLGNLDDMQILPAFGGVPVVYRPVGAPDPTQVTTLTWDACQYTGDFGFENGSEDVFIERYDSSHLGFYASGTGGAEIPFAFPSGPRASFELVLNGPNSTVSAYYNYGSGYTLVGTVSRTAADFAALSQLLLVDIGTGSNPSLGIDNIQITTTPVPEPSTLVLLSCGLVSLGACAWRKRK